MDRGAWWGRRELDATEQLSTAHSAHQQLYANPRRTVIVNPHSDTSKRVYYTP